MNGNATKAVTVPTGGCTYLWVNSNPGIGLPASGIGDIPSFTAINTGNAAIYATVTATPVNAPLAYIGDPLTKQIKVVNTASDKVVNTITLNDPPTFVTTSADGTKVYVTGGSNLYVINTSSQSVIDKISVGSTKAIVASPDGSRIYLATGGINPGVTIVNTATRAVGRFFFNYTYDSSLYRQHSDGIAISPDGTRLYVATGVDKILSPTSFEAVEGYVTVVNTFDNTLIAKIDVDKGPLGEVVSNDGKKLYVANSVMNSVYVINTAINKITDNITVGEGPMGVVLNADGTRLYVTNSAEKTLSVVNTGTNKVTNTANLTSVLSEGLSITPDGKKLFVTYQASGLVTEVNTTFFTTVTVNTGGSSGAPWLGNFITGTTGCTPVTVNYVITPTPAVPTIIATGTPGTFTTTFGTASKSQSFSVSSFKLTEGILVKPPDGFEVSTDNITFSPTVTVGTGGDIPATTVYIRLAKTTAVGSYGGDIVISSAGAVSQTITITGNVSPAGSLVPNQTVNNGQKTALVTLPGTSCVYKYSSDKPEIGLNAGISHTIPSFTAINTGTTPITAKITARLSSGPENNGFIQLVNQLSGKVAELSIPDNIVQYIISTEGAEPYGITISPDRTGIYVTNRTSGTVSVVKKMFIYLPPNTFIDYKLIAKISVGVNPEGLVISPDASKVYVANAGDGTVSVINTVDNTVLATIALKTLRPSGVAISSDGSRVYVTNNGSNSVSVINTADNTVINSFSTGLNTPKGIAVSPDGNFLYVANQGSNTVSIINTATGGVNSIGVGTQPFGVSISLDGSRLYVSNQGSNNVSIIDATNNSLIKTVAVGTSPRGISVVPDGSTVYVANYGSDNVSVINTADNSVTTPITSEGGPFSFGIFADGVAGCAIGDFSFNITINPTPPSIAAAGTFAPLTTGQGVASASTSINVSGLSLTQGILVTPPNGFEVSSDNITFGPTVTIGNGGNVTSTPIYIRLAAGTPMGNYSGNVVLSSSPAANVNVEVPVSTVTTPVPTIVVGTANGNISACTGTPSASPNIMKFTVSAVNLTSILSAAAPAGFEISLSPDDGYKSNIDITNSDKLDNTTIYVRSLASALGNIAGSVSLNSLGAAQQKVDVYGVAFALPTAETPPSQTVINGFATTDIHFKGTGNTFNWTNDKPEIGLKANGVGDISSFKAINNTTKPIVATITATPVSAALAYVTNFANNSLSVINISTNEPPIATITVGSGPRGLVISADATRLYVMNYVSNDVTVVDATTNTIITTIPVGLEPENISMSADGSKVYVYNQLAATVSVISTVTNAVIATTYAGLSPPGIPTRFDGKRAYVYNYDYLRGGFDIYDTTTNTVIGTIPGHTSPQGLTLSPDGTIIYASDANLNKVYVIDAVTVKILATIDVGIYPQGVSVSRDGKWLYVANGIANNVSIINTTTYEVEQTLDVNAFPSAIVTTTGTTCGGTPVTCTITVNPTPPTITATGTPVSLNTIQGNPSTSTTFTVSGIKMQEGILVTPPAGFEVSADGINYSATIIIGAAGTITSTTVYIRIAASTLVGTYAGDIVLSSLNAESVKVSMPNSVVSEPTSHIDAGLASGSINSCAGTPSASPNIQQFTASGYLLASDITVTAPAGFEISLNSSTGYANGLTLVQSGGNIANTIIYVRSSATAVGSISGNVNLKSSGATDRNVFVKGAVGTTPTVNTVGNQTLAGGMPTAPVNFTGTGNTYSWTNDTPGIGLAASGFGNIASFTTINKGGTQIVANITVTPLSAAMAYVAMQNTGIVNVINTASNQSVGTISLGSTSVPYAVAASLDGKYVYVANQATGDISVINTSTNTATDRIIVGKSPSGIVVTPNGNKLYVTNNGNDNVSVYDILNRKSTTIKAGLAPEGIAVSPDGNWVYVANRNSTSITVINTNTDTALPAAITVGASPEGLVVSPDGSRVYVTNYNGKSVSVIDATTNKAILPAINVGTNPHGIAINPDGTKVYVGNAGAPFSVSVINTATNQVTNIPLGSSPQGVSISPDGSLIYVAGTNNISVIKAATNTITTIPLANSSSFSFGNFITGGAGCVGIPTTFKIIINPTSPYISTTGTLTPLNTTYGTPSASTSFSVSGISMTAGILVTPPAGYEVSLDNATFTSTVTFGAAGVIAAKTVYIRLAANASVGINKGNILLSSTGAADTPVPTADGTVVAAPLTITANNVNKVLGTALTGATGSKAFTYTGIQNLETIGSVTIAYGTGAEISAAAGTYTGSVIASFPTGGTFSINNYLIKYLAGDIIVKAALSRDQIIIPNTFTPNGDGINDTWEVKYLLNYPNCMVMIYDRSGKEIFRSSGYSAAWNGTIAGKPLPFGTYYYVINLNNGTAPLSGYVLLVK